MNLFWEFHESKVTWSMRQLLRNHYMLLNLQPWPARTCVSGRVWFHHQCHLQGCSRSGGSAAGLLFSQTSKIAETPDRLVSMAEWLIPRYEASKLICAAVLDASVFSFCAPVMCIFQRWCRVNTMVRHRVSVASLLRIRYWPDKLLPLHI